MPFGFRDSPQSLVVSLYASVPWHNPLDYSSEEILTPVQGFLLPIQVVLPLNHSVIQGCKHWGWQRLLPFKKNKLSTQFSEGLHANMKNLLHTTPPAINTLRFIWVGFNKIIGKGGSQSKGLCYVLCHRLWPVIMDITVTLISQHNVVKCKLLWVLSLLSLICSIVLPYFLRESWPSKHIGKAAVYLSIFLTQRGRRNVK